MYTVNEQRINETEILQKSSSFRIVPCIRQHTHSKVNQKKKNQNEKDFICFVIFIHISKQKFKEPN